jgi:hypothetical protein
VEAVSEINVDRTRGLTLLPVSPRVPVELGWGGYGAKLTRLPAVLRQWAGREAAITSVSVRFPDEVIVRTRAAKSKPEPTVRRAPVRRAPEVARRRTAEPARRRIPKPAKRRARAV